MSVRGPPPTVSSHLPHKVAFTEKDTIIGGQSGVRGMNELLQDCTRSVSFFMTNQFPQLLQCFTDLAAAFGMLLHFCPTLLFYFLAIAVLRVELCTDSIILTSFYHLDLQLMHALAHSLTHPSPSRPVISAIAMMIKEWRKPSKRFGPPDRSGETLENFKAVRAFNRQEAAVKDFSKHLGASPMLVVA